MRPSTASRLASDPLNHRRFMTYLLFVAAITTTFSISSVLGADGFSSDHQLSGFRQWAEQAREDWGIPGFALAVVKDGETIFAEGFGQRNMAQNLPFTANTVSHIGSTTKAFVAMSLAMLADSGELDWDDKVNSHLAGFRVKDSWVSSELSIRDIITHRGGFRNHDMLWGRGLSRQESVERMANIEQASSIRTSWAYNNLGYLLAGEIVAARAGMSMEEFITTHILQPLGMSDTTLRWENTKDLEMLTDAHNRVGLDGAIKVPYSNIDAAGGAGVMNSTVADMAKW